MLQYDHFVLVSLKAFVPQPWISTMPVMTMASTDNP
jgi:hypothetical protein